MPKKLLTQNMNGGNTKVLSQKVNTLILKKNLKTLLTSGATNGGSRGVMIVESRRNIHLVCISSTSQMAARTRVVSSHTMKKYGGAHLGNWQIKKCVFKNHSSLFVR